MCSYNQVNGVPACARKDLLQKIRNEWGFQGYCLLSFELCMSLELIPVLIYFFRYIVSDCDAVGIIRSYQSYTSSDEDSVAIVLKAGKWPETLSFSEHHIRDFISMLLSF